MRYLPRRRWRLLTAVLVLLLVPLPWARASNDPLVSKQWALRQIDAASAWQSSTGSGVRIGIVDTGVDLTHEDLAGKVVAHTNCIGSEGEAAKCRGSGQDDEGHGTHVAGIAAAIEGNSRGIVGVAPDAELVVAKALDSGGFGTAEDVNAGIRWVVDHGAKVVNLSLGDPVFILAGLFGSDLQEGVDYAWARGAVPVLASGNSDLLGLGLGSSEYGDLPAIVVGASDHRDRVADYSSPTGNARWALLAPGGAGTRDVEEGVLSSYWVEGRPNQYGIQAGTSVATPHVSGAVALLLAQGLSQRQAVDRILQTVDTRVACGANSPNCHGRLDAARAVGTTAATSLDSSRPAPPLDAVDHLSRTARRLLS